MGWKNPKIGGMGAEQGLAVLISILYQLGGCCWALGGSSRDWVFGPRCEGGAGAQGWKMPDAKCLNFSCDLEASLGTAWGCPGPAERGKA